MCKFAPAFKSMDPWSVLYPKESDATQVVATAVLISRCMGDEHLQAAFVYVASGTMLHRVTDLFALRLTHRHQTMKHAQAVRNSTASSRDLHVKSSDRRVSHLAGTAVCLDRPPYGDGRQHSAIIVQCKQSVATHTCGGPDRCGRRFGSHHTLTCSIQCKVRVPRSFGAELALPSLFF